MERILVADRSPIFLTDIENEMMLGEFDDIFEADTLNDINELASTVENKKYDYILLDTRLIESLNSTGFACPVYAYARNSGGIKAADEAGIECLGVISDAEELLIAAQKKDFISIKKQDKEEKPVKKEPVRKDPEPKPEPEPDPEEAEEEDYKEEKQEKEYVTRKHTDDYEDRRRDKTDLYEDEYEENIPRVKRYGVSSDDRDTRKDTRSDYSKDHRAEQERDIPKSKRNEDLYSGESIMDRRMRLKREEEERLKEEDTSRYDREIERDLGYAKPDTKVITVYSAKGGVGKTTISCELATYLSLTEHGRGRYKVCLIDFNVDFGDVLPTLALSPHDGTMTLWGLDIKERAERLKENETTEDIVYSQKEIREFLQFKEDSGLYVLPAPINNKDSSLMKGYMFEVMLRNIVENGGFDFVICDTGNNTRDSSIMAVEMADMILVIVTQDVRAINDIDSFLKTMESLEDVDMDKFKLVINKAMSTASTGVNIGEIKEVFVRKNGKRYPTIATIADNNNVKIANNNQRQLVFNKKDKFTASIGQIAMYIIGDTFVLKAPEKKGLLSRLFGK